MNAHRNAATNEPYRVSFVCTGTICRSPIGAVIASDAFKRAGLDHVEITSAGMIGYHTGDAIDRRAGHGLRTRGFDGSAHRAHPMMADELRTIDLVVAMDGGHLAELRELAAGDRPDRIRLMRSFDPASPPGAEIDDPYYGGADDFERVLDQVETAMPGLVEFVRSELGQRSSAGSQ